MQSDLQEKPNSSHIFVSTEDQHLCQSDALVLPVQKKGKGDACIYKATV